VDLVPGGRGNPYRGTVGLVPAAGGGGKVVLETGGGARKGGL